MCHVQKTYIPNNPHHFVHIVEKTRFLVNFWVSRRIFAFLVNKCWPKFLHDKKAQTLSYKTLVSIFSYLTWFLRYFYFFGSSTRSPDFQITTFIYVSQMSISTTNLKVFKMSFSNQLKFLKWSFTSSLSGEGS